MRFLIGLEVVYGDEPANAVKEIHGLSNNINDAFGGQKVWLVPVWDETVDWYLGDVTVENIEVSVSDDKDPDWTKKNLAEGAGGEFRYIDLHTAAGAQNRITDIALIRVRPYREEPRYWLEGWEGHTGNINDGRGDHDLYLVWKMCTTCTLSNAHEEMGY